MGMLDELRIVVESVPASQSTVDEGGEVVDTIDRSKVLGAIIAFEKEHPGLVDKTVRCDACGAGFADRATLRHDLLRRMDVCPACTRDAAP